MTIEEISKKHTPEIAVGILCCRVFLKTAPRIELEAFIQSNSIDWSVVYQFSATQRIRPLVYQVLSSVCVPAVLLQFRNYCHLFSVFAFDRQIESLRIQQLLRQKGVAVRMYKGLDFSLMAYGDISLREFTDMDLIINMEDVSAVVEVMSSEGYACMGMEYFRRFPARFLASHKDITFQKRCPRGRLFAFEFHYRPVKSIMTVSCSFPEVLGPDYLSAGPLTHQQYYQLMLLNHGASDYYPDLRSLLDLAMLAPGHCSPLPEQLQRFEYLWQLLAADLLNYNPSLRPADPFLRRVAEKLSRRLLAVALPQKTFLGIVRMQVGFSRGTKLLSLIKAVRFILRPNENDINGLQLPFSLYYFTKPFRLIKQALK